MSKELYQLITFLIISIDKRKLHSGIIDEIAPGLQDLIFRLNNLSDEEKLEMIEFENENRRRFERWRTNNFDPEIASISFKDWVCHWVIDAKEWENRIKDVSQ